MDRDVIFTTILTQIREVVPELESHSFSAQDAMSNLGVDSVDRQEILILTLEAIGLDIPMVQLHGPRNIGELADLLHAKLAA